MKQFSLTLILVFAMFIHCFSQEIKWQKTYGGISGESLSSIRQTSDGGYILGGFSDSDISGNKTENSNGLEDYWVIKTDSLGNIQWQNTIGGSENDRLLSVQQTSDGGYILGGNSESNTSGDKIGNGFGGDDYWIVKIDALGNIQWQNTIGGFLSDQINSVIQTSDNGYLLCGSSNSDISAYKTVACFGAMDYWIVKVDSLGAIQWQKEFGGNAADYLTSATQTTDGGFILGGYSSSDISGNKTENTSGNQDYWIVKIDMSGNIQWQNTIGGLYYDELMSLEQTSDGGYILGGYSISPISGDKTENSLGGPDYWIVKTDSVGNIQWQNTIGGNGVEQMDLGSVKQTLDSGYIIAGFSNSDKSGDKTENSLGAFDYWIVKTDSLGSIQWQNTIGGNDWDVWMSLEQTSNGEFILGGTSMSNISGDKSENCFGNGDYWIVKLIGSFNLVTGKLFADFNNNNVQDSGELSFSGKKITEQNTGRFAFSDQNGRYSLSVFDTGSYSVSPPAMLWYNSNPAVQTANFTGMQQIDSLNDFAYQSVGSINDVCVTITPLGAFRNGSNASYQINYGNYGTTIQTPTVIFYPDYNVTFQSATQNPSLVTLDSVVWSFPAMSPFQTGSFVITVNVNASVPIGSLINSTVHIEPFVNDVNQSCNNSSWEVYSTGSFDPNEILVSDDTLTVAQISTAPWLDYIINFQNTGNDTAFTVKILNPIDTNKLNLSTIEFVNASHPVNLSWLNYQRSMEFKFDNILLADSNTNEPLSHGFVRYRIQPKMSLNVGDTINNFASIYFDFNNAVLTNIASTNIVILTGLSSLSTEAGKLFIYPNPSENKINITGIKLENGKAILRLTDIYGKLILEKTISSTTTDLEIQKLPSGIYLIQSDELRATFVKQ